MSVAQFQHAGRTFRFRTWGEADAIHLHLATAGTFYEEGALAFIRARGLRGVYVDIGANIGNHAVYFASLCSPSLLIAIDGNAAILPLLEENLRANRPAGQPVWVMPGFISTRTDVFFTQASDANVGGSFVSDTAGDAGAVPSRAWPLDELCRDVPRIDLLKIDVEGHEMEVFNSGDATIRRHYPDILVESFEDRHPQVRDWLADRGYFQLTEFKNYNWYFVHVGAFAVGVHRLLRKLPFALHSRLGWRWVAFACAFAHWRRRRRPAVAVPPQPPVPLHAL